MKRTKADAIMEQIAGYDDAIRERDEAVYLLKARSDILDIAQQACNAHDELRSLVSDFLCDMETLKPEYRNDALIERALKALVEKE
jgi:hypothetical protein